MAWAPFALARRAPASHGLALLLTADVALASALLAARWMVAEDAASRGLGLAVCVVELLGIIAADRVAAAYAASLVRWEDRLVAGAPHRTRLARRQERLAAVERELANLKAEDEAFLHYVEERRNLHAQQASLWAFNESHLLLGYEHAVGRNHVSIVGLDATGPTLAPNLFVLPGSAGRGA